MMLPLAFRRPMTAFLFIRTCASEPFSASAESQEDTLREYCEREKIRVVGVARAVVEIEDSLAFLKQLFPSVPAGTDLLLATRLDRFSTALFDLSGVCYLYRTHRIELQCLEIPGPLRFQLNCRNNPYSSADVIPLF